MSGELELFLCKSCFDKKINVDLKKMWITEILKYPLYGLEEFLPRPPSPVLRVVLKDYIVDESIRAKVNEYFNSHPDDRYSSLDLHAIAQAEKEILLQNLFESHSRSCDKCGVQYQADSIWKYTICPKCAETKKYEWESLYANEVLGYDDEYIGILPTPPLPVDTYLIQIDEVKPKKRMDKESASRIQSHADKNDTNQDFKARAQAASARNEKLADK